MAWIASLCRLYRKLPSEIEAELDGDHGPLFLACLSSDHFMEGWEARRSALRASDGTAKQRIQKEHRVSIALVERVMAQLHDDADQEPEDDL